MKARNSYIQPESKEVRVVLRHMLTHSPMLRINSDQQYYNNEDVDVWADPEEAD